MRRSALCLAAFLALSCGNTARPDFVVHLVNASNGGDPFGTCSGDLQVDVQQSTNAVVTTHATLNSGRLTSFTVEIPSYGLLTEIHVTATCNDGTQLIGATPRFFPVGYPFVDIVLGRPTTCERLASPMLRTTRRAPHLLTLGANVIAVGGLEADMSPSTHVQALDSLSLTSTAATTVTEFDALTPGAGLGGAAVLGDTTFLVVSDFSALFDAGPGVTTRVTTPSLHAGAGSESAVVSLNGRGVAVVGGLVSGVPANGITWFDSAGHTTTGTLRFARRRPAAVAVGASFLLVAGGQAMGDSLFELVPLNATSSDLSVPFGPTDELRYAPVATASASHASAWVGLGNARPDDTGAIATTTWEIGRCSASGCDVVRAGADYPDPRGDVAVVEHHVGLVGSALDGWETLILGGSDPSGMPSNLIDRLVFDDAGHVTITPFGTLPAGVLPDPRTGVGATDIGSGILLVAAGVDDAGTAQQDVSICFPAALRPITAL